MLVELYKSCKREMWLDGFGFPEYLESLMGEETRYSFKSINIPASE